MPYKGGQSNPLTNNALGALGLGFLDSLCDARSPQRQSSLRVGKGKVHRQVDTKGSSDTSEKVKASLSITVPAAANASDARAPERDGVKPAVNGSELRLIGFGDRRELVDSRVWRIERIKRVAR